jgi:hypothetical protein
LPSLSEYLIDTSAIIESPFLKGLPSKIKADSNVETIWASQKQIAQVFDVTPQNITIHLKQIFTKRFAF